MLKEDKKGVLFLFVFFKNSMSENTQLAEVFWRPEENANVCLGHFRTFSVLAAPS